MQAPIRVLQVIPTLNEGGAERTVLDVSQALIDAEHKSFVATSGGRFVDQLTAQGAQVITLPVDSKNPITVALNIARLAAAIKDNDISIVHARSRAPAWSAMAAARRCGIPFVTTHHGTFRDSGVVKSFYNSVMARGDVVIANSSFIADRIRSKYPDAAGRMTVIPRGADLDVLDPDHVSTDRVSAFREAASVSNSARIVLLPGRLTPWKGQAVFLEAAKILRQSASFQDVVFVAPGEAPAGSRFVAELKREIEASGMAAHFKLSGHCDDMAAAYHTADLVVSASKEPEAFGRIAIEAQAMATPIVATALGGSLETVIDKKTGWLCNPGDAQSLADTIQRALATPKKDMRTMGQAGRESVLRNFSKKTMCEKTLTVYFSLLGIRQTIAAR